MSKRAVFLMYLLRRNFHATFSNINYLYVNLIQALYFLLFSSTFEYTEVIVFWLSFNRPLMSITQLLIRKQAHKVQPDLKKNKRCFPNHNMPASLPAFMIDQIFQRTVMAGAMQIKVETHLHMASYSQIILFHQLK